MREPISRDEALKLINRLLDIYQALGMSWNFPADGLYNGRWVSAQIGYTMVRVPELKTLQKNLSSDDNAALLARITTQAKYSKSIVRKPDLTNVLLPKATKVPGLQIKLVATDNGKKLLDEVSKIILNEYLYTDQPGYLYIKNGGSLDKIPDLRSDDATRRNHAFQSLIGTLGDPQAEFIPALTAEERARDRSAGVGIFLAKDGGGYIVAKVLRDAPADWAGVRAGDRVLKIGKDSVVGMHSVTAGGLLYGSSGSMLDLTLQSKGKERHLTIRRVMISKLEIRLSSAGDVLVIDFEQFGDTTEKEFQNILATWIAVKKPRAILLDFRGSAGGSLYAVDSVASSFLGSNVNFAQLKVRGIMLMKQTSKDMKIPASVPVYVLVDEYTSSIGVTAATALQENGRAVILGKQTKKDGALLKATIFDTSDILTLTYAELYTSKGFRLKDAGITPEVLLRSDTRLGQMTEALSFIQKVKK
jgi:carboxyl-terminal processing protease